jgi:RsmE family RNA methyltransferase
MNLILLFEQDFVHDSLVALSGRRLAHLLTVHKAKTGDTLRVGRLNGLMGEGTVQRIDSVSCVMNVAFNKNPPPPLDCTLLLALPRPKALLRIVESATAMGVKRIYVMESWRVEKSFWNSPSLSQEEITEHCVFGLEQARDTVMPDIQFRRRFKPFVEDEIPSLVKNSTPLVAHPGAIVPCQREHPGHITLAVGPEGGFIPYEVELLQTHGFTAVHFGPRILRTECFVSAAIARLF